MYIILLVSGCGTQEKESKGGPAVGQPRLRRLAHGCRGIPCFFFPSLGPAIRINFIVIVLLRMLLSLHPYECFRVIHQ